MSNYFLCFDKNVEFPTRISLKVSADSLPEAKEAAKKWLEENKDAVREKQNKEHIYNVGDPGEAWPDGQEGVFITPSCVDPDFVIETPKKEKTYTIMYYDETGKTILPQFAGGAGAHGLTWTKVKPANLPDILNDIATRATRVGGILVPETKSPFVFMRKYGDNLGLIPKGALTYAINNPDDVIFISFSVGYPDEV